MAVIVREKTMCVGCDNVRWESFLVAPDRYHGREMPYRLVRCPSCSLVRLDNPPTQYDSAISGPGDNPEHWKERHEELLRFKTGGRLLDLGCSSGGFLTSMQGPAWKLFGVEMSEKVAKRARERCGAEVFVGDILDA